MNTFNRITEIHNVLSKFVIPLTRQMEIHLTNSTNEVFTTVAYFQKPVGKGQYKAEGKLIRPKGKYCLDTCAKNHKKSKSKIR